MEENSSSGDALTGTLKKKFGPLPFWAWLAILVALLAWYLRKRAAANSSTNPSASNIDTSGLTWPVDQGMLSWGFPQVIQGDTPTPSNTDWAANAMNWITSHAAAGITPLKAQQAITKYLAGQPLSHTEQDIINTIISGVNGAGTNFGAGIGAPPSLPTPANNGQWQPPGGWGGDHGGVRGHGRGHGGDNGGGDNGGNGGGQYVTITGGTWLSSILSKYGLSYQRLLQLNPNLPDQLAGANAKGYVNQTTNKGPVTQNVFYKDSTQVRVA